jgi:tetratricopeptide (TPR) repeat protein
MAWMHDCLTAWKHAFMHSILLFTLLTIPAFAQSTRSLINDGVEQFTKENFADAEVNFKKAVEQSPESFEAKFNLGNAYYKQQRYDEAINSFQSSLASAKTEKERAEVFYNIGNSLLKSNKLDQSITAYKESLKLNPDDMDAKYNLSYALNQKNNPQQDQQQNKNDEKKDDQENKDQNQQNQDQQQKKDEQQQQQPQQQQPQEQKISKEEAQRILDALKDNEKELQKELRKIQGQRVKTEKDW